MFKPRHKILALAWGCGLLFVFGLTQLFLLRFESGDVYPPYSSLRSDPLGVRALFEGLNRFGAQTAQRNYRPLDQVALGQGRTLLICGLKEDGLFLSKPFIQRTMERLANEGGRLVLAFTPASRSVEEKENKRDADEKDKCPKECDSEKEEGETTLKNKRDRESSPHKRKKWHGRRSLGFELKRAVSIEPDAQAIRARKDSAVLPHTIAHRAPISLVLQDDAWQPLYTWNGVPVVATRSWGDGTLVLSADSYVFSNEALRSAASAKLPAWFVGPYHEVVFDEFHHGLSKRPGIASLARKYRLHGLFATLLILTLLFVWRRTAVFVPLPADAAEQSQAVFDTAGGTSEGLVNLMQQHIHTRQLLPVCHEAWRTSATGKLPEALLDQVETLVEDKVEHDPVTRYRQICELLEQGRRL